MLKLSKKADYALIAVRHLATHRGEPSQSASDIAEAYGISAPLLAKVLQRLAKHGLLTARHGSSGGYQLARHPKEISALDVINASIRAGAADEAAYSGHSHAAIEALYRAYR